MISSLVPLSPFPPLLLSLSPALKHRAKSPCPPYPRTTPFPPLKHHRSSPPTAWPDPSLKHAIASYTSCLAAPNLPSHAATSLSHPLSWRFPFFSPSAALSPSILSLSLSFPAPCLTTVTPDLQAKAPKPLLVALNDWFRSPFCLLAVTLAFCRSSIAYARDLSPFLPTLIPLLFLCCSPPPFIHIFLAIPFIIHPNQLSPFAGKPVMIFIPLNSSRCDLSSVGKHGHRRTCAFTHPPSSCFAPSPCLRLPPDLLPTSCLIFSQDAARSRGAARSSAVRPGRSSDQTQLTVSDVTAPT